MFSLLLGKTFSICFFPSQSWSLDGKIGKALSGNISQEERKKKNQSGAYWDFKKTHQGVIDLLFFLKKETMGNAASIDFKK